MQFPAGRHTAEHGSGGVTTKSGDGGDFGYYFQPLVRPFTQVRSAGLVQDGFNMYNRPIRPGYKNTINNFHPPPKIAYYDDYSSPPSFPFHGGLSSFEPTDHQTDENADPPDPYMLSMGIRTPHGFRKVADEFHVQPPSRINVRYGTGENENRWLGQAYDYGVYHKPPSYTALLHYNNSATGLNDCSGYNKGPSITDMLQKNQSNTDESTGASTYYPQENVAYRITRRRFRRPNLMGGYMY